MKSRLQMTGFTLIELIIVVAIVASISAGVFVALDPARRLNETKQTRVTSDAAAMNKAISLYIADTGQSPVAGDPVYDPEGGGYRICKTTIPPTPTSETCVNLDALIPNYLPALPTLPEAEPQTTGFAYIYTSGGTFYGTFSEVEYTSSEEATESSSSQSSLSDMPVCPGMYSNDFATEIAYQVDSRITGLPASNVTKNLFTVRGSNTLPWTRSATVWTTLGTASFDMTGASPWNSNNAYRKAGTLISPRHFVYANHYTMPNGSTIIFVDNDNNIVTRTVTNQQRIGLTDMQVAVLDSDVPPSITYYPILPYANIAPYVNFFAFPQPRLPILSLDQDDHATLRDMNNVNSATLTHSAPFQADRLAYNETLISGDSGNPAFFLIGNQPVLLTTHWTPSGGPYYGGSITLLNQAMTALGGGYQVTEYDPSPCFAPI